MINSRCCRFFYYLTPQNYNRYNRLIIVIIFPIHHLFALKTSHFPYKIQNFRTFPLIYLHISNFFRTFAAGFFVRTYAYNRIYVHTKPTMPTTTQRATTNAKQYEGRSKYGVQTQLDGWLPAWVMCLCQHPRWHALHRCGRQRHNHRCPQIQRTPRESS